LGIFSAFAAGTWRTKRLARTAKIQSSTKLLYRIAIRTFYENIFSAAS